uniref:Myosin motor domain-containing protein n=1 Tax=Hucho hucho TaxID=62062 RepID=A0A4W5PJ62_9TELE
SVLPSPSLHSTLQIKEKKEEPTSPPPPLSALPGGFLKQLVRETEKETKQKEPEVKEEKAPSKLSDNLVQQFLLPDQTPPILEAEMALRNEHLVNGERGRHSNQSDLKTSSPRQIISPEIKSPPLGDTAKKEVTSEPQKQEMRTEQLKQKQEVTSEPQGQEVKSGKEKVPNDVRDVWYEVGTVWYVHKEGFSQATQLKPDEGTPDLTAGLVRVRMETDGTLRDVMEHDIHKLNPSELDLCEDLSELQSVNECGALHTLTSRAKASLPLTHAGPNLLNFWPPLNQHGKTPRSRRGDSVWDAPPALAALVRRVYVSMVGTRRDQSVCAVGRSGTGKTTSCQAFTHTLLKQAGTAGDLERIQAVFTILRSFGCVSSQHSDASSRFAMVLSLDFNHAGLASAGHLQTMMLEKWRVCQKMEGESNFLVFSQMLAGLSTEMRTELQMHQFPEANSFGIVPPTKVTRNMAHLGTAIFRSLQRRVQVRALAGPLKDIQRLVPKPLLRCLVGRRAFVSFDSAQVASSVLGCEGEELHTAVFKHHLRQLLQRATGGGRERHATTDAEEGPRMSATQCVDGMASGLYEELFTAIVSLINRALSSQQLTLASVMVVDTPGLRNPRHSGEERAAGWSELCHNYLQERLLEYYYTHTFTHTLERYAQDRVQVDFEAPETSPAEVVSSIDQPALQVTHTHNRLLPAPNTHTTVCYLHLTHTHNLKLQADALLNLIRRASPVFLQCVGAKTDSGSGGFDVPALRIQLHSTHILPALQLYRTGYPEHMTLSDFRCRFQALSPPVMKRYGSVFITPDERKAVEELLVELDLDKKSIVLGACRVFMKRGVLKYLDQQRDKLVSVWLVQLQAACMGHLARQQHRKMKVQQMAVRCVQSNIRTLRGVAKWSWWKLLCRVRPLLDVNMDDQRLRAKEDEITALRRRLEKSERERNELRQTTDILETKVTAVSSELSDERFRGEAVSQALDMERGERLRLTRENKELQARLDQCKVTMVTLEKQLEEEKQKVQSKESQAGTGSEMALQLECCQTEVEYVRRRLKHTEERLEAERQTHLELDTKVGTLQAQLEQSKKSATELKRQVRRVTSDLQDARVLTDSLQGRAHELDRKQRRFDSELTQALEEADKERELKDKAIHESTALGAEIYALKRTLQESLAEVVRVQQQKEELCAQIRDLSVPFDLASDSLPDLKKQLRLLETQNNERGEEITKLTAKIQQAQQVHLRFEMEMERMKQIHLKELEDKEEELEDVHKSSQRRLRQLEMQLEQEYEEKQMVVHEKHDLEGLIATLCDQVGHRDFDVEKRLRRDLKRTHALLVDAQLLLSTIDNPGHSQAPGSKEHIERLHCQLEESEARRAEVESVQKTLSMELENAQIELENICKHKSLVDEQVAQLQHDKSDLLKRLEEDQEDLNELMKKHKALIAQSSSDISQIRELQAELEEVKKQRHTLQEELATSMARMQFLESSTVGRSIVSMQEARVCDLENKLEFQRGQVKRFEVLVLRLRDSVVRLGEELEQSAQTEVRERENSQYYQQRLHDMRHEVEDLSQREQDSSRRCMELSEVLSTLEQVFIKDLSSCVFCLLVLCLCDLCLSVTPCVFPLFLSDSVSSVGSQSLGTEDVGEGIRHWLGVPRGGARRGSPYGSSTISNQSGRQSVTDTMSTYSFRSCVDPDEDGLEPGGVVDNGGSSHLGRASSSSALSELLEGLRKRRGGAESGEGDGSTISLPIYQTTGASTLRRRASALSLGPEDLQEPRSILKPPSPLLPRAASLRNIGELQASSAASRDSGAKHYNSSDSLSSLPSLPLLSCLTSPTAPRRRPPTISIPEEDGEEPIRSLRSPQRSPQPMRRSLLESVVSEGGGEGCLGSEPMVFQNRRLLSDGNRDNAASDILPAIRRAQSTSSLASSVRGGRRALSVHFGELPPSTRSRKGSDSSSTSSGSGGSSQGGGVRRSGGGGPQGERLDAEGSEGGDVASVMKKYLRKSEDLRKSEVD